MKGKMIHFGEPYGCSPEDIARLHLKIAWFLIGVVEARLFQARSCAWFQPKDSP